MPSQAALIICWFSFGTSARDIFVDSDRGLDTLHLVLLSSTIGLPISITATTHKELIYSKAYVITILEANAAVFETGLFFFFSNYCVGIG